MFVNFAKVVKIVNCSVINVISKDRRGLLNCSIRVLRLEVLLNFPKFRYSFVKIVRQFSYFINLLEKID